MENRNIRWNWVDEKFLTEDSFDIVSFIYYFGKNDENIARERDLYKSNSIKWLFEQLYPVYIQNREIIKKIIDAPNSKMDVTVIQERKKIDELLNEFNSSRFVSKSVKEYIDNTRCILKTEIKIVNKKTITQFLIHEKECKNIDNQNFEIPLEYTSLVLYFNLYSFFLMHFSKIKSNKISVCLTPFIKKLPEYPKKKIGACEVNTGATSFSYDPFDELNINESNPIILWRKEEVNKVLIHELIHSNNFDKSLWYIGKNPEVKTSFTEKFDISDNIKIKINESYTEVWATLIHSLIVSIEYSIFRNKNTETTK